MTDSASHATLRRNLLRAIVQGLLAGVLLSAAFAGGFYYRDMLAKRPATAASFSLLSEVEALLNQHFLYPIPDEETRVHGAVNGLVASYDDPYTIFVEPQAAEVDTGNLAGRFGGIGAEIGQDEQGRFVIQRVYRDNPAHEAGLQEGDIIIAVDGVALDPVRHDLNTVISMIRGNVGDPVVLRIQRGGQTLEFEVIRAEVLIPSTFWRILDDDPRIGYIQIVRFTERAPQELRQALSELGGQGAEALVLDLRNNGGGLVDSAVAVAGEFLDGGVVLYEERQGGAERVFNASRGGAALDLPLVVLINQNTASAAEIVAGAIQDRGRAQLVGQPSFGKGSVQLILPVSDGSSLHVTTAQWFTPAHHRLEGQGLTPDVVVQPVEGTDAELAAAVEELQAMLPMPGSRSNYRLMG